MQVRTEQCLHVFCFGQTDWCLGKPWQRALGVLEIMNLTLKKTPGRILIENQIAIWYSFNREGNHQLVCLNCCYRNIYRHLFWFTRSIYLDSVWIVFFLTSIQKNILYIHPDAILPWISLNPMFCCQSNVCQAKLELHPNASQPTLARASWPQLGEENWKNILYYNLFSMHIVYTLSWLMPYIVLLEATKSFGLMMWVHNAVHEHSTKLMLNVFSQNKER